MRESSGLAPAGSEISTERNIHDFNRRRLDGLSDGIAWTWTDAIGGEAVKVAPDELVSSFFSPQKQIDLHDSYKIL